MPLMNPRHFGIGFAVITCFSGGCSESGTAAITPDAWPGAHDEVSPSEGGTSPDASAPVPPAERPDGAPLDVAPPPVAPDGSLSPPNLPDAAGWSSPSCSSTSAGFVTWTPDLGETLTPTDSPLPMGTFTSVIVPLSGGHLLAVRAGDVWQSVDAGCTWVRVDAVRYGITGARRLSDKTVMGWGYWSGQSDFVARIDLNAGGATLRTGAVPKEVGTVHDVASGWSSGGFRLVGSEGYIRESIDGLTDWRIVPGQKPPPSHGSTTSATFSPADANHMLLVASGKAYVTRDGGASYVPVQIDTEPPDAGWPGVGLRDFVFSETDPRVVYGTGRTSLSSADTGLYRSVDGGSRFSLVASGIGGRPEALAVSPLDPGVAYWVSTLASSSGFGEVQFLYAWNASAPGGVVSRELGDFHVTSSSSLARHRIASVAPHPTDTSTLYFGLERWPDAIE